MKPNAMSLPSDPAFQSVTGLTNTTFDAANPVADRGATEGQLVALDAALSQAIANMDEIINSDDGMLQAMWNKLQTLTTQIEECCTVDHGTGALDAIWARIEALEAEVAQCRAEIDERVQHVIDNLGNNQTP